MFAHFIFIIVKINAECSPNELIYESFNNLDEGVAVYDG